MNAIRSRARFWEPTGTETAKLLIFEVGEKGEQSTIDAK
jgi:hypothetical protein